jgi:hypothetical protein
MRIGTFIKGLLLVLIGTVLFLINFGYGSWASLLQIGKWWPILLIILGLGLLSMGRIPRWIACVVLVISVLALSTYMVIMAQTHNNYEKATVSSLTISRQQYPLAKQANLTVDYGGGQLLIAPGGPDLFKGDFASSQITKNIRATDQVLTVNLDQTGHSWSSGQLDADRWQLQISPELAWNMNINAGAIDGTIDLTGVPLEQLNCNVGAGNMNFILNNKGTDSKIKIIAGASNIKLNIPGDSGVSIELGGALNCNNLDELGWSKTGSRYLSPNYYQAASKIDCDIQLSAGNLDVKTGSII